MSARKVFVGMLVGAAAGATLGVLFAPGKGSALKKICRKGEGYIDSCKKNIDDYLDSVKETFEGENGNDETDNVTERTKTHSRYAKNDFKTDNE